MSANPVSEFDLAMIVTDEVPEHVRRDFVADLSDTGLTIVSEVRRAAPMAALEWWMLSPAAVYIAERYFSAFIQEAGKAHYAVVKAALARLARKFVGADRSVNFKVVVSTSSPMKGAGQESAPFGAYAKLRSGKTIKFLFEAQLADGVVDDAVGAMMHILREHYEAYPGDALEGAIAEAGGERDSPVLMRFDPATGGWRPFAARMLAATKLARPV